MPSMNLRICLATILLLGGSSLHASVPLGEPQVTFVLNKGFLEYRVEKDGVGIKKVLVRVLDLAGQNISDSDSEDEDNGTLGLSNDSTHLVGITIPGKKKEADLITLRRDGKTITPSRVLLSFSKPCCRVVLSSQPEAEEAPEAESPRPERPSFAWIMLGVSGFCMLAAGMMLMFFRRA